jgi:hypothetical protein
VSGGVGAALRGCCVCVFVRVRVGGGGRGVRRVEARACACPESHTRCTEQHVHEYYSNRAGVAVHWCRVLLYTCRVT